MHGGVLPFQAERGTQPRLAAWFVRISCSKPYHKVYNTQYPRPRAFLKEACIMSRFQLESAPGYWRSPDGEERLSKFISQKLRELNQACDTPAVTIQQIYDWVLQRFRFPPTFNCMWMMMEQNTQRYYEHDCGQVWSLTCAHQYSRQEREAWDSWYN